MEIDAIYKCNRCGIVFNERTNLGAYDNNVNPEDVMREMKDLVLHKCNKHIGALGFSRLIGFDVIANPVPNDWENMVCSGPEDA
jgi:rubredoxin